MRVAVVGLLALALVLAGCSAFSDGVRTPTVTPAEVPPEPTAMEAESPPAPGIVDDDVADVDRLADSHVAAIANRSYRWNETQREYRNTSAGNVIAVESRTEVVTNGTAFYRKTEYAGASPSRAGRYVYELEEYGDEGNAYTRWFSSREGEPAYSRATEPALAPKHNLSVGESIRTYLDLESADVTRVDFGREAHVLVTGTLSNHSSYGPVEGYHVRALVREDGFVRRLSANFTVTIDGERIPVEYRFVYTNLATERITPPGWLAEARERVGSNTTE